MKLLAFLLRSSKSVVTLAIVVGIISGIANAALIAFANSALSQAGSVTKGLLWGFIGLAILLPLTRAFSGYLLIRLAQKVIFDLRLHLCKRILGAPLRHLEEVGAHRLLASLTEDVNAISNAFINVPVVCIHLTVVVGCMGYSGMAFVESVSVDMRRVVYRASQH